MNKLVLTRNVPPTGERTVPTSIPHVLLTDALKPVLALLGLGPMDVLADRFVLTSDSIEFLSAVPVAGIEPEALEFDGFGVGVWVWPVRVEVLR